MYSCVDEWQNIVYLLLHGCIINCNCFPVWRWVQVIQHVFLESVPLMNACVRVHGCKEPAYLCIICNLYARAACVWTIVFTLWTTNIFQGIYILGCFLVMRWVYVFCCLLETPLKVRAQIEIKLESLWILSKSLVWVRSATGFCVSN